MPKYFWNLLSMFQHFDPLDRTAWYFRILWLVLHLCRSESDEMSSVTHLSFQLRGLCYCLVFVCSSQSRVLLVFSNCHLRWSCGPVNINYYNLPQLSPVDACDRQGPRMGDTQAGENLVEFFQTNPSVWSNVEHVRDIQWRRHAIFIHSHKFWRFGFKSILQTSLVQRIYFPDKLARRWSFRPRLPKLPKLFQLKQLMWKMCKPTRRSLQLKLWARPQKLRRWGKWPDWCGVWRITLEHFGSRAP